jgi:hypothetical protein
MYWSTANNWTWKMVEDNYSRWSLIYNCNQTWQIELPDGYFILQKVAKDARRFCKEKGSEGRRGRKKEVKKSSMDSFNSGSEPDYQIYMLLGWAPWWG